MKHIGQGKVFDENFLMSFSTIGALYLGEMAEAVFVMLFYQVGEAFQEYAVARSRKSITALLDIRPDFAHLIVDDEERKVDPSLVQVGDMILVKAGERIPLDGVITEGHAMLDTAALTGESLPRSVGAGDQVLSGCINMDGSLKVRVEKGFGESTVMKILEWWKTHLQRNPRRRNSSHALREFIHPLWFCWRFWLRFCRRWQGLGNSPCGLAEHWYS